MKWEGNRESSNVEDRRDDGGGGAGGGLGGLLGGRSIGIGTIVVALLGGWAFGINPLTILNLLSGGAPLAQVQQQEHEQRYQREGVACTRRGTNLVRYQQAKWH